MSDLTDDLPTRVAVLEQIARTTTAALERIDRRLEAIDAARQTDFRWLIGIMLGGFGMTIGGFGALLAVMAHGFHWL